MTYRLRDFVGMNPLIFHGFKVGEYPQVFLDDVYKVLSTMRVTSREKADLASYQLRRLIKCGTLNRNIIGQLSRFL